MSSRSPGPSSIAVVAILTDGEASIDHTLEAVASQNYTAAAVYLVGAGSKELADALGVSWQATVREMLDQVLHLFDIKPDIDLDVMRPGQDLFQTTTVVLNEMRSVLEEIQPELVIIETTGLADPKPIIERLRPINLILDAVITMVDASTYRKLSRAHETVVHQVEAADFLVGSRRFFGCHTELDRGGGC